MVSIVDGIVIGAAGGAIAGLTVWLVQYAHDRVVEQRERERVYGWIRGNTSDEDGNNFRSTRAIASHNNLTMDRVRYLASVDERIFMSTGNNEDMWSIYERGPRARAGVW